MVWDRYLDYTDRQLVALTHREGTPWGICFEPNMNKEIPDSFTKMYYEKLVKIIVDNEQQC